MIRLLKVFAMREIRRKTESGHQTSVITTNKKLSMTLIATICYRSETLFINIIPKSFKKKGNERRAFAKNSIQLKGDIIPDYENDILTVISV